MTSFNAAAKPESFLFRIYAFAALATVLTSFFELRGALFTNLPWITPFSVSLILTMALFLALSITREVKIGFSMLEISVAVFIIINAVSGLNAINRGSWLRQMVVVGGNCALFFMIVPVYRIRAFRTGFSVISYIMFIILMTTGCVDIIRKLISDEPFRYMTGFYDMPNRYALSLIFCSLYLLFHPLPNRLNFKATPVVKTGLLLTACIFIALTYMRAIYVSLPLALIAAGLFTHRKGQREKAIIASCASAAVFIIFLIIPTLNDAVSKKIKSHEAVIWRERDTTITGETEQRPGTGTRASVAKPDAKEVPEVRYTGGTTNRLYQYTASLRMFLDYPVIGVGLNNFYTRLPEYADERFMEYKRRLTVYRGNQPPISAYPHNSVIRIAAETGIVGIGWLIGTFVILLQALRKSGKKTRVPVMLYAIAVIIFMLFNSMFDEFIHRPAFWICLALFQALINRDRTSIPKK